MPNVTNRVPQVKNPVGIIDVFSPGDLPPLTLAPDGAMRSPIVGGATYYAHETFVWPLLLAPAASGFTAPEITTIVAAKIGISMLFADTSAPAIWGRDIGTFFLKNIVPVDISNGGAGRGVTMFDLVGGGAGATLNLDFASIANFKAVGRTMDVRLGWSTSALASNEAGISALQSGLFSFVQALLSPALIQPAGGPPMKKPVFFFRCGAGGTASIGVGPIDNNAGDSFLAIDSTGQGSFSVTGMSYPDAATAGDFFRPDVSLALTVMADVSKSITAFTADAKAIVAAAAGPGGTIFVTGAVRHQWNVGDTVTHSGMGIGAYDGVKTIGAVFDPFSYLVVGETFLGTDTGTATNDLATVCASAAAGFTRGQTILVSGGPGAIDGTETIKSVAPDEDSFILPVDFATVGAGTGTIELTRVTTTSDHPMFVGETCTISGTTSYNFETQILFTEDDDTFDIPVAFVADDATGTVSSISKTERDVGVCLNANGAQKDSKRDAAGRENGNAVVTTVAAGAYGVINVPGFANVLVPERFTLTTATEAKYTFNGEASTAIAVTANIWAFKGGPTENYRFSVSVNGATPVFATAPYSPMEVRATKVMISHEEIVQMDPGDTVQMMVAGDGTGDDPAISDFSFVLRG